MHKLQQLFDRLLGIEPESTPIVWPPADLFAQLFSDHPHRFAGLATPACWRRADRAAQARVAQSPVFQRAAVWPAKRAL